MDIDALGADAVVPKADAIVHGADELGRRGGGRAWKRGRFGWQGRGLHVVGGYPVTTRTEGDALTYNQGWKSNDELRDRVRARRRWPLACGGTAAGRRSCVRRLG